MRAEILSVGTELLLGTIADTNAQYLAQRLATLGIDCFFISQVGDNEGRLVETLRRAWGRSDLVVVTGGLGPTQDDLTREAIAELLSEALVVVPQQEEKLRSFFALRGTGMPEGNIKQAMAIPSATLLENPVGTAPGWWVERGEPGSPRIIVAMPGVPFEMKRMWEHQVEPHLRGLSGHLLVSRTLKILGLGESRVEELVADLMQGANPTLAPYAKQDGVHLRITAKAPTETMAHSLIEDLEVVVRQRLGDAIYGADGDSPDSVTSQLLAAAGLTFAILELGTGAVGSIGARLAALPQSRGVYGFGTTQELVRLTGGQAPQTIEEAAQALQAFTGADVVIAARAEVTARGNDTDTVKARIELCIQGNESVGGATKSSQQSWRTSSSEVRRLCGLAGHNLLRLYLLERYMVELEP